MKFFLCFLLFVTGGLAYYEYTWQGQSAEGFATQLAVWQDQVTTLEAAKKKLADAGKDLKTQITEANRQMDLMRQAQAPTASPDQLAAAAHGAPLAQSIPLGTLITIVGKTYHNVQVLKIGTDDLTISSDEGITQVPFAYMSPEMQKRFTYDSGKADALKQAQSRYQEQLREATAPAPAPGP
jgi:hypothetical protein